MKCTDCTRTNTYPIPCNVHSRSGHVTSEVNRVLFLTWFYGLRERHLAVVHRGYTAPMCLFWDTLCKSASAELQAALSSVSAACVCCRRVLRLRCDIVYFLIIWPSFRVFRFLGNLCLFSADAELCLTVVACRYTVITLKMLIPYAVSGCHRLLIWLVCVLCFHHKVKEIHMHLIRSSDVACLEIEAIIDSSVKCTE